MHQSTFDRVPSGLHDLLFAFVVYYPDTFHHSNGVRVLLDMAQRTQSLGLRACVVPCYFEEAVQNPYDCLSPPYQDLEICWDVPLGCCAIICDSLQPHHLNRVRSRAHNICHYTLAPLGMFSRDGSSKNSVLIEANERQAVYSPAVSTQLPYFYWQTRYHELESFLSLRSTSQTKSPSKTTSLLPVTCFYVGKGYPKELPSEIRSRINRYGAHLITRLNPSRKEDLYKLIGKSRMLICFDPLTSLAHEATLLGVPVFICSDWDEKNYLDLMPVKLSGLSLNNETRFLKILDCGFDQLEVIKSYWAAIEKNTFSLIGLLSFAALGPSLHSSIKLNEYWASRKQFFQELDLPSPPSAWGPLTAVFPAQTPVEKVQDICMSLPLRISSTLKEIFRMPRKLLRYFRCRLM